MTVPIWKTTKNLGVLNSGSYFEKQLEATDVSGELSFYVISGQLPTGIMLGADGLLAGVPLSFSERDTTGKFTVRARNNDGNITDRAFMLLIAGIAPPVILTEANYLGTYYDGSYFNYQLNGVDSIADATLTWKVLRGSLPNGVTLSKSGLLEGFILQVQLAQLQNQIGWDKSMWDLYTYDLLGKQNNKEYEFTVELSDGISVSRRTFIIDVIAKDLLTTDGTRLSTSNNRISIDHTPQHLPFISTMPQTLPEIKPGIARQDTYFAFKFDGIDFDNEDFSYEITSPDSKGFDQDGDNTAHLHGVGFDTDSFDSSNFPMPMYVGLNNETGWYTGQIAAQVEHRQEFTFQVFARKLNDFTLTGPRNTFKLVVLGQVDEEVIWVTDSNLGLLDNGAISGLQIFAKSSAGKELVYRISPAVTSRTPQGVVLLPNGMLSGRASFEYLNFDNEATTMDGGKTTFDNVYAFTVIAQTENRSSYSEQIFSLRLNTINKKPYENLYLRGFPPRDQRLLFESIMANEDLFPSQLIYRLADPWYGKAHDLKFLFMSGINPSQLVDYVEALGKNHYNKSIAFGDVKTAVALDDNYNILYEVVYLDVIDELEGKDPVTGSPKYGAQAYSLSDRQHYFDNDSKFNELTPNGLGNMSTQIANTIGISKDDVLPLWMTSVQLDSSNAKQYQNPLGYVRAVVLAYTVPGASKLIAYRLKNANFSFNQIPFKTDRYQLDNFLTTNYDSRLDQYIPGKECVIDQTPSVAEQYREIETVTYAVTVPFEKINGRHIDYIKFWNCLDSTRVLKDGDTLIFPQQEGFQDDPDNQYVNYDVLGNQPGKDTKPWPQISRNIPPPYMPYGETNFDHGLIGYEKYLVNNGQVIKNDKWLYWIDGWMTAGADARRIPGFVDHIMTGTFNERAAIYQISIDSNGYVTLTLKTPVIAGDIVAIQSGKRYGGKKLCFEAYVVNGNVPRWTVFSDKLLIESTGDSSLISTHKETTFDNRGTRFFSGRDQYAAPDSKAKYIKFPKLGVFI